MLAPFVRPVEVSMSNRHYLCSLSRGRAREGYSGSCVLKAEYGRVRSETDGRRYSVEIGNRLVRAWDLETNLW